MKPILNYEIDPRIQGVNRLFVLSSRNNVTGEERASYSLLKIEIKYYNFMIDAQNSFDQPVNKEKEKKNALRTYDNI